MTTFSERLRLLRSLAGPDAEKDRVLLAAWPDAGADELPAIAEALARSGRPEALRALIRSFHRLDDATAARCAAAAPAPARALAPFREDPRVQHRLSLMQFIALREDATLAGLLVDQLAFDVAELRRAAAEALLALTELAVGSHGRAGAGSTAAREALDEAVSRALDSFRGHREPAALLAAAIMCMDPGPRLRALLEESDGPASFALRGATEHLDRPQVRRNLLRWLLVSPLDRAALRRLGTIEDSETADEVLAAAPLIAHPGRRRALRQLDRVPPFAADPGLAMALSEPGQSGLIDLIGALGISTARRVELLGDLIVLPSPLARGRLVRALHGIASTGHEGARRVLEQLAFDRNEHVAAQAARARLDLADAPDDALLARMQRSPHPSVAETAAAARIRASVDGFFAAWHESPAHERQAATRRWMSREPQRFFHGISEALRSVETMRAAGAIELARQLRATDRVLDGLIEAAASETPWVASAAIAGLGESVDADAREPATAALLRALEHEHPRVRANAIDAMLRLAPATIDDRLPALGGDSANRPRACAVAGLLMRRNALGIVMLRQMLADWNPMHRISAIWAARSRPDAAVREELWRVAETDPHPEVRIRAVRAWQTCQLLPHRPARVAMVPARSIMREMKDVTPVVTLEEIAI